MSYKFFTNVKSGVGIKMALEKIGNVNKVFPSSNVKVAQQNL